MESATTYHRNRRITQGVSTIAIIAIPFLDILRLDIPTLRFYFFRSVLWVDEFYLLFLATMLILWVIIAFSMVYGRVWCGWMCPQTVISDIAHALERGIRKRMKLPRTGGPRGRAALALAAQTVVLFAMGLLIGFNLVAYFVDPYRMLGEIASASLGPVTTWSIVGIALLVAADALFWREKFCTKACPYGMMQVVVTDKHTQVVRYHTERAAECIECKACIRECPMGIDIRVSPHQTECIHCGDCIDACSRILGRLNVPTLITFTWGEEAKRNRWWEKLGMLDAKRWLVGSATVAYMVVLAYVIGIRQPLAITATGDRSTLYRTGEDGKIYNDYQVKVSNRSLSDGSFTIRCASAGAPGTACSLSTGEASLQLRSREVRTIRLSVTAEGSSLKPGPNPLTLEFVNEGDNAQRATAPIVFFMPEHR